MALFLPVAAWNPTRRVNEILYYWVVSGTLQANITPRVEAAFPHIDAFYYWIAHSGLLVYVIYTTVVHRLYPTWRGILRAFVWLNVFAALALVLNLLLDTNYLYLRAKPPTVSLLDYFGPWPWYILVTELAALVMFWLAYLPFSGLKARVNA